MPHLGKLATASLASRDLLGLNLNVKLNLNNPFQSFNQTSFNFQTPDLNNSMSAVTSS